MKKTALYILGVIVCLILADITVGVLCRNYIKKHRLTGRYLPLDRLIKEVDTDIILIGNSAILNSTNPDIMEDSLGMNCYNGGITGQGVDFFETIIDCILQRHTPKMIVIGMRPEEMGEHIGDGIYDVLKPYYGLGYKSIDDHFNNADDTERLLMHSNLYRYNTIWVRVLLYMLFDKTIYQENGFMPKDVPKPLPNLNKINKSEEPLKRKLDCIERIIRKCIKMNIKVAICYPPTLMDFGQDTIPCVKAVNDICNRYNIRCLIYYNDKEFQNRPELFYDDGHVNKKGADEFSKILSHQLKAKI